jgi:hypothetical protein
MNDEQRRRPGAFFTVLGVAILGLIVASNVFGFRLGPLTSFFEDAILFPIALLFVGRALNRRANQSRAEVPPVRPARTNFPPPAPKPVERPRLETAPFPDPILLSPDSAHEVAVTTRTAPPVSATTHTTIAPKPVPQPPAIQAQAGRSHEVHHMKSSEEMVAEAKRKLADRHTQRPKAAN